MIEPTSFTPLESALGGALIGLAAVTLMAGIGKIAGISGILRLAVGPGNGERAWKLAFVLSLVVSAWAVYTFSGFSFPLRQGFPTWQLILGGLLVGYGTAVGSGCTSGHGVCGIARFSGRSLVATAVFMASGIITAVLVRHAIGGGS
ncbi:MAG: YeeE/YedE thiosulfate transporter family protein [Xanthomonadales bacterium]|nr:YeeE/YedE thiosulfate transporter family protein [Xanthomonadales bacterium]